MRKLVWDSSFRRAFKRRTRNNRGLQARTSDFQRVIENVEALPVDDQMLLVEIIRQRLIQHRRSDLIAEVAEARQAYQVGNVRRGTVGDLLKELDT